MINSKFMIYCLSLFPDTKQGIYWFLFFLKPIFIVVQGIAIAINYNIVQAVK